MKVAVTRDVSKYVWNKKERVKKKENVKNYKSQQIAGILIPISTSQKIDMRRGKMQYQNIAACITLRYELELFIWQCRRELQQHIRITTQNKGVSQNCTNDAIYDVAKETREKCDQPTNPATDSASHRRNIPTKVDLTAVSHYLTHINRAAKHCKRGGFHSVTNSRFRRERNREIICNQERIHLFCL